MLYRHTIDATNYAFDDLRILLAKASPPRSGDRLAGIAADSAAEMIAARSRSPTFRSSNSSTSRSSPMRTTKSPA